MNIGPISIYLAICAAFCAAPAYAAPGDLFVSVNGAAVNGAGSVMEFDPITAAGNTFVPNLSRPRGVAFDSSGNLFVTNTTRNTDGTLQGVLLKFDATGAPLTFPGPGLIGPSNSFFLEDLKIDNAGNIFVIAQDNPDGPNIGPSTIYKFTPDGTQSTVGSLPGQSFGLAF